MGNMMLGWPNRIDDATLTGGSWNASLPLNNLKDRQITKPARSTDATLTNTLFNIDLGQSRSIRCFALVNHNLSATAKWKIKIGTTSGGAELYDSGWLNVWRLTFDSDMLEWEDPAWWEGISDTDYIGSPFAAIHIASQFYTARYFRIEIDDTTNAAGYVQAGRVFIGGGFVPSLNVLVDGFADAWEDLSQVQSSDSGSEWFNNKRRHRTVRGTIVHTTSEFSTIYEMQRRLGTTGEVLYVQDINDAIMQQRTGFLGRMRQLSPIEFPWPTHKKFPFEIKEII